LRRIIYAAALRPKQPYKLAIHFHGKLEKVQNGRTSSIIQFLGKTKVEIGKEKSRTFYSMPSSLV
jgi:hypothetical protein